MEDSGQSLDKKQQGDVSDEEIRRRSPQNLHSNVASMRLSSEQSEDEKSRNKSEGEEGPNDEIAQLFKRVDTRMSELLGVEKRLDDIEKKAVRLFDVVSGQLKKGFVDQVQEMNTLRKGVFRHLEQMDGLLKRTVEARDLAIEQHTRDMVERHVNEVEYILQHIEELARELEKRQPSRCARLVRSALWSIRITFLMALVLAILVYILLDDDETHRLFSWVLDRTWTTVEFVLKQRDAYQTTFS